MSENIKEKSSEKDNQNLLFKFLGIYFEEKEVLYKTKDLNNGVFLIEKKLKSFLDKNDKIIFLKKYYSEIYPSKDEDVQLFDTYNNEGAIIKTWEHYFEIILSNNPNFLPHFFERVKPFSNKYKDPFDNNNFIKFYNFFSDITMAGSAYENMEHAAILLVNWSNFSKINHQLNWIKTKIKELEKDQNPHKEDFSILKLEDIFIDKNKYKEIIKHLLGKNIIDDKFNILPQPKQSKIKATENRIISGIGFLISQKRYIKKISQKDLVKVLSNTFNWELKENTYSIAKTDFANYYPNYIANDPNLSLLTFI